MALSILIPILVLATSSQTNGHGYMTYPIPWHNQLGYGLTLGPVPDPSWDMEFDGVEYPPDYLPEEVCEGDRYECSPYRYKMGEADPFTNNTFIPGEPTLPDDMYDVKDEVELQKLKDSKHPWTSPGTAPVFGNGCGAAGGSPYGCQCEDDGPVNYCYGNEDRPYGSCCGQREEEGNIVCAGYIFGQNMTEHAGNGIYDDAANTVWARGSSAAVIWTTGSKHKGGYAYRLCKVGGAGLAGVTEECFREGHLKFDGPDNWLILLSEDNRVDATVRQTALRTTEGTTPEGSEWTRWYSGEDYPASGYGWKDLVKVPGSLEPGNYILSFRWDCQQTAQIWQTCANVQII